jgi:hypothetical protein
LAGRACPPGHGRGTARAITLAEILVAGALMAGLSLVLFWAMLYAGAGQRKQDADTEGDRSCALAIARLEEKIQGGRVVAPVAGQTSDILLYRYPRRDASGNFFVLPGGAPQWLGPATVHLETDPQTSEQLLVCDEVISPTGGPPLQPKQMLARLGPLGSVSFSRPTDRLLRVTVVAQKQRDRDITRSFKSQSVVELYLQNQGP